MAKIVNRKTARRKDLWAVRVFEDCGGKRGSWVLQSIHKSEETANQEKTDTGNNLRRSYPLVEPKVDHPTFFEVDVYLSYANTIY